MNQFNLTIKQEADEVSIPKTDNYKQQTAENLATVKLWQANKRAYLKSLCKNFE
ncbi:MAG: hypothetical protein PF517_16360 [Salinivirgaceae bacterium]|jgi:hypothetical protein|nr:hypothetical protein [Salinivirgaceae bacterium]